MADIQTGREALVSAYLLGHASEDQILEFEALYDADASFRALVAEMELYLAPLSAETPPADPPAGLLDDIMATIAADEVANDRGPAREPVAAPAPTAADIGRRSERPWQYATAASLLIAAVATGLHFYPADGGSDSAPTPQQELLALMSGDQAPSVIVLLYDRERNVISGRLANAAPPEDGVWQLWLLREGIDAPQSLGLLGELAQDGSINLHIAEELAAGSDTLAISVEPEGGSPEAGPTGPVVFTGKVNPI